MAGKGPRYFCGLGVGLLVEQRIEVGSLLNVKMPGPKGRPAYKMLACVVHVANLAEGEWLAGCTFIRELSADELQPLLRRQGPGAVNPVGANAPA